MSLEMYIDDRVSKDRYFNLIRKDTFSAGLLKINTRSVTISNTLAGNERQECGTVGPWVREFEEDDPYL